MSKVKIYDYSTHYQAVLITGNERNHNMPINNSVIKVHKGSNETLSFHLFDADGKGITINTEQLFFSVFDKRQGLTVFSKLMEQTESTKVDKSGPLVPSVRSNNHRTSVYECTVDHTDILNWASGSHYTWTVHRSDHSGQQFMKTGLGHEVTGEFHIDNGAAPQVEPTVVLEDRWTEFTRADVMDYSIVGTLNEAYGQKWLLNISDVVPGEAQLNVTDGLHTVAVQVENFTGIIQIQACLDNAIPDDQGFHRWFLVPSLDGRVNHEYFGHTGIDAVNFHGNFQWLRIVYYKRDVEGMGEVKRVLVRR